MKIHGLKLPGRKGVVFELDPRSALFVWFHLQASMHTEVTTSTSRMLVAGILPQLRRAVLETGFASAAEMDGVTAAIMSNPAPPPIDIAVRGELGDA